MVLKSEILKGEVESLATFSAAYIILYVNPTPFLHFLTKKNATLSYVPYENVLVYQSF